MSRRALKVLGARPWDRVIPGVAASAALSVVTGLKLASTSADSSGMSASLCRTAAIAQGTQFITADILLTTCRTIDYGVGICGSTAPYLERITSRAGYLAGEIANFADLRSDRLPVIDGLIKEAEEMAGATVITITNDNLNHLRSNAADAGRGEVFALSNALSRHRVLPFPRCVAHFWP